MAEDWIDVSVPLRSGMVHWPDNPPVLIERALDMGRGDAANVSKLSMGVHTGTHMDAPIHFFPAGKGIDSMPLTAAIGRARVIEISDPESIKPGELRPHQIQAGERILFKTRNSARCWQTNDFVKDFIYISSEAAQYLAEQKVQTVGVDYLSVGGFFKDGAETHHALLGAGIWIIEGLNLSNVRPGFVELICLPLKIEGSDGASARAILRLVS
ncbi:MAG TPA: cyclase family protein [Ktedonobacteraceae bacterium]